MDSDESQLLAECNAGASARYLVSITRARKLRKLSERVDFSEEVAVHREGIEDGYGRPVDLEPDEEVAEVEALDRDDDEDAPAPPPRDHMGEVVVPTAMETIKASFDEMISKVSARTLYAAKKNAAVAGLGIVTAVLDSPSGADDSSAGLRKHS